MRVMCAPRHQSIEHSGFERVPRSDSLTCMQPKGSLNHDEHQATGYVPET